MKHKERELFEQIYTAVKVVWNEGRIIENYDDVKSLLFAIAADRGVDMAR